MLPGQLSKLLSGATNWFARIDLSDAWRRAVIERVQVLPLHVGGRLLKATQLLSPHARKEDEREGRHRGFVWKGI